MYRKGFRQSRHFIKITLIYSLIMISFFTIKFGYSIWTSAVSTVTALSTGSINTVISECSVADGKQNFIQVYINEDKKSFNIFLDDVYPKFTANIKYKVTNIGTIPIKCKVNDIQTSYVEIKNVKEPGQIEPGKQSSEGIISITIKDVKHCEQKSIPMQLVFNQYNVLN